MDKMQTAINSVRQIESEKHLKINQNASQSKEYTLNAVGQFWLTMAEMFGGRFTNEMGAIPNDQWIALFSRLNSNEVARGYERMRADERFADWPPTVIRFEYLCKPTAKDMELPDTETAYQMATGNHPDKHKAVAWTLQNMGAAAWNMKNSVEKTSRPLFAEAYQKHAVDWMADGNTIPEIKSDNPSEFRPEKTQCDRDAHSKFMRQMQPIFGLNLQGRYTNV